MNVETDADGSRDDRGHGEDPASADGVRHEVAEGDGPVNALDAAMRKALNGPSPTWPKCTWSTIKCG